ncbi:MAG: glycosyltransferase family 39 protein [Chloroflexota bacterium]|nr:glycosyltransferase family 39 protein [Chloroflexota bacterium]MDE2883601.1 glycosyltransferase family 39 protein [Chloroflexota bacterium]
MTHPRSALSAAFPAHPRPAEAAAHPARRIRLWEVAVLAALTFVALVLRVQDLETTPAGMAQNEAALALEALRVSGGEAWPGAWTSLGTGTPAGLAYLQALLLLFMDASVATARLSAALPGVVLIPVAYLLVRQLFSARTAVITAAFLTFHVWFLVFSRVALPAMPAVLCFTGSMWLLIVGVRSKQSWVAGVGGVLFGLGWYVSTSFPLYAAAVWGALVLLLLLREETRRAEVYWFLGASVAASAHMLFFHLTSDVFAASLGGYERTPLSPWSLAGRAWEVLTYVHTPTPQDQSVGAGGIPLLHFSTEVFFWAGLGALLLFIRRRSSQLLLLGWLVSMAPAVLFPDEESRRYLLGILFVLAISAVGLDTVMSLLHNRWRKHARTLPIPILAGWSGNAVAAVVLAALVLFFAAQQSRDYDNWLVGSEWALTRQEIEAVRFAQSLGEDYEVRLYNDRLPGTSALVQWSLRGRAIRDGSPVYGGSGSIDVDSVHGPTVWLLSENYLTLIPQLEAELPGGRLTFENNERGELLYAAYVLDASY